jgi:hypothetical protein
MTKKIFTLIGSILIALIIVAASLFIYRIAKAEQSGGSPESGATSRLKTIYNSLVALGHGSDAAGSWGDWGAFLNRIRSAGEWVPNGTVTVTDVKNGITFYNDSRTVKTGTYPNPTGCSTQQWHDSSGSATEGNNCSLTWTTNPSPVAGDDNKTGRGGLDPRTGLTWSQYLKNNAGTVEFAASGGSTWNWDGTLTFTVTAANATAGAVYSTPNGKQFTVVTTIAGGTSLKTMPTGSPDAAPNTLTKVSGTGDATINYSATPYGVNNAAVGGKSASQLCSERGNGWRLPTQKELMQAYIDGSNWNLTNPANYFWPFTENDDTYAWIVNLGAGYTNLTNKATGTYYVRCVR